MEAPMTNALSLNLPMTRNGDGTSWFPDASPIYGYMANSKKWMFMFHGNIAPRYDFQDIWNNGTRGDQAWDAPIWIMAMGQTKLGMKGLFHFNIMMSFDALT